MFQSAECGIILRHDFAQLIEVLGRQGYQVIGPTVRDRAIIYDALESAEALPVGWADEQQGGTYRLKRREDGALFGYGVGPQSWKKFLHLPVLRLWRAQQEGKSLQLSANNGVPPKLALIGVRPCELHALVIQDKVLMGGNYIDAAYKERRQKVFIVAVNCAQAGGTCFCASMNTGPKATFGFDLALTEIIRNGQHSFFAEVGSEQGAEVFREIPHHEAGEEDRQSAERVIAQTTAQMGRSMDTADLKTLLYRNYEHPRWDEVASRCLSCANCTLVCPTCFCTTVEDVTDLTGQHAERWRKWDSCFTMDFSFIHAGSVRASPKSRYRQWLTHKLATWIDQFGTSGCVGCGRCITWCPVGIDITEEVDAIRQSDGTGLAKEDKDDNQNA